MDYFKKPTSHSQMCFANYSMCMAVSGHVKQLPMCLAYQRTSKLCDYRKQMTISCTIFRVIICSHSTQKMLRFRQQNHCFNSSIVKTCFKFTKQPRANIGLCLLFISRIPILILHLSECKMLDLASPLFPLSMYAYFKTSCLS